jgi:hypothetical protein
VDAQKQLCCCSTREQTQMPLMTTGAPVLIHKALWFSRLGRYQLDALLAELTDMESQK